MRTSKKTATLATAPSTPLARGPAGGPPPATRAARKVAPAPWSAAFVAFMKTNWRRASPKRVPLVAGHAYIANRRKRLCAAFPGELLIVPTGHEKVRANDTTYPFRAGSDFYYLTGCLRPGAVVVLDVGQQGRARTHLFVEGNPGRETAEFFADAAKGELWVGPQLTVKQSGQHYGIAACQDVKALPAALGRLLGDGQRPFRVLRGVDAALEGRLGRPTAQQRGRDREFAAALSEMRLRKDAHEVRALRKACASTERGFVDVIERLAAGQSEREVEGVFFLRARTEGNQVGYSTIAAAGHHACTLHWSQNDGPLKQGDLLLLDAGVEGVELYTADVTRTLPISGRFTPAQREIYDLVHAAQAAGFAEVKPGNDFMAANRAAMRVLAHGLMRLGIIDDAERDLEPDRQLYRRYTLHNVSHMLGIDVHDCAAARALSYRYGKLEPGMVLTVEPGIYFQPDDLTVPKRYRGIGVRIEDDLLVTNRGHRLLSNLPRASGDVEAWMRDVWARKPAAASTAKTGRSRQKR